MENITTITTSEGQFIVEYDGGKYFLKYEEDDGKQAPQVVGYLIKEGGEYCLQEAFFDKLNYEHALFHSVSRDELINKDLTASLTTACFHIEKLINENTQHKEPATYMTGVTKSRWTAIIHALQKGTDLETAVLDLQAKLRTGDQL